MIEIKENFHPISALVTILQKPEIPHEKKGKNLYLGDDLEHLLPLLLESMKKQEIITEKKTETLREKVNTEELEETEAGDEPDMILKINYSFQEEQFILGQLYNTPTLDYVKMFYGEDKKATAKYIQEEEYATNHAQDTERDLLSASEAKELFMDMQYAMVTGASSDINFDDRRKFNYWIMFNRALFGMFESEGVTREVNYAAY